MCRELPEVDIFVGTGDYPKIAEIIAEKQNVPGQLRYIGDPNLVYDENFPRLKSTPRYTAYLKIAEGCSNCCTYCVIPALRGSFRSRPLEKLVQEARELVSSGVKELNVIAQDVTNYGKDLPGGENLEGLVRELVKIEGLSWVRLLYAYPDGITDGLIELIKTEDKICKYLDIPLQHISDRILVKMKRRGGEAEIRALLAKLRTEIPDLALRTSIIVGFPGETDEDFSKLLHFVEEARFDRLGVFCYSKEEGTPAAEMPDQVSERVKRDRYKKIMKVQARVSFKRNRRLIDGFEQVARGVTHRSPALRLMSNVTGRPVSRESVSIRSVSPWAASVASASAIAAPSAASASIRRCQRNTCGGVRRTAGTTASDRKRWNVSDHPTPTAPRVSPWYASTSEANRVRRVAPRRRWYWSAMRSALFPRESTETPMIRPGICRL